MTLNPIKLAFATALVSGLAWTICGAIVTLAPEHSMWMSEKMLHADLEHMTWSLDWGTFFIGLVSWTVIAGVFGWLVAALYNKIL